MDASASLNVWQEALTQSAALNEKILRDATFMANCVQFSELLIQTFRAGGNLYVCGNGGSHCEALHFAEEFTGRFRKNRRPLGALALGEATHLTCVGNDFGFEDVFARQIEGLGRAGDLLVGLSTSGNSRNVEKALQSARAKGLRTAALLGRDGGSIKKAADLSVIVPAESADRIQEIHLKIIHTAIEACERSLFPENY